MEKTHMASFRTKNYILNSFSSLLVMKDFSKITITDILNEAGISKGTFYKYFQDKYDLSMQVYRSFFEKLEENILSKSISGQTDDYCDFFNDNKIYYEAMMKIDDGVLCLRDIFKEDLKKYYIENIENNNVEADLYANQTIWIFSYFCSLNRKIEREDVEQYFSISRNFSLNILAHQAKNEKRIQAV